MKKIFVVFLAVLFLATAAYGHFRMMEDGFMNFFGGEPDTYENYQVSDGVGGWENYQVSDGVGGWENYQVVE